MSGPPAGTGTHAARPSVLDAAAALADDLVALRSDVHRHPELGNDLPRTQQVVLDALAGLDLEVTLACAGARSVPADGTSHAPRRHGANEIG